MNNYYGEYMPPVQQGWQCPICGRILSPWTWECPCGGRGTKTYMTTGTGNDELIKAMKLKEQEKTF